MLFLMYATSHENRHIFLNFGFVLSSSTYRIQCEGKILLSFLVYPAVCNMSLKRPYTCPHDRGQIFVEFLGVRKRGRITG